MAEIKYEIKRNIAIICDLQGVWGKELNLISWNWKEAKYDLRDWTPGHEKIRKGITQTSDELRALKEALNNIHI